MMYGPTKDKQFKSVLGAKFKGKPGHFWIYRDKEVWKEFKKGDQITKTATKLEKDF